MYCILYLNRRIIKKSILLFSSRHAIAMRMPMQGSCHSVVCTTFCFPSLALPCPAMNPTYPYTAPTLPTSTRHPFDWRLAFFFPFLSCILAPADPVGYLSHVLRLHRERENSWVYCTTCISVPVSTSIYTSFSLYTDFVYKRKACKLPARALSLSHPSLYLSIYPPLPSLFC